MAGNRSIRLNVRVQGSAELAAAIGQKRQQLIDGIDRDVEVTTLQAINKARAESPILTGELRRGIQLITQDTKPMSRTWAGTKEYTQKQEYEHATKKGFMRRAQWEARTKLKAAIDQTVGRLGGSL